MNGERKVPRRCRHDHTEEMSVFFKTIFALFDIYFYINHIRYTTFSRFLALSNMHVHRGRFLVQKAFFSTLSKGYIPETRARARPCVYVFFQNIINIYFISIPSDIQSYPIYNLFSRLLALRNIYSGRLLPLNIYSGRHWVRNALGMMDCHIHYAIVTVRFCTDIFSRFFALRNTRAGHDGQYWDDSIRKRLLRRRN